MIVKNLPLYFNEDKLKEHFAKHGGNVTDAKLMRKHNGQSRRFGFVGFKTSQDASEAVRYFNMSFINTTRIEVALAKELNDPQLVESAKQRSEDRDNKRPIEEDNSGNDKKKRQKNDNGINTDSNLAEYLNVMDPTKRGNKSWANDIINGDQNNDQSETSQSASAILPQDENEEEYDDSTPVNGKREDEGDNEDDEEEMMPLSSFDDNQGSDKLAADENVSDFEWLQNRRKLMRAGKGKDEGEEEYPEGKNAQEQPEAEADNIPEVDENSEKIQNTRRLFVRNLLYSATENDLTELFSPFGSLDEVHLPIDNKTSKPKGFAYILFSDGENAVNAYESLDGKTFQGRLLHILPAQPKRENKLDEFDLKDLPLKKQRELRRKANAAKQQFSWNSLYLNSDAVMESAANRLGITKSELLNPESSDAAVQQALAETSVLNNIRQYFETKGVDLNTFSKKERSDKVILVKNFPYETTSEELVDLFGDYGDLKKVLMPPDGGIAMVVYKTAPQGRAAFTKLAYRRFKTSILYLEKGPSGLFEDSNDEDTATQKEIDPVTGEPVKEVKPSKSEIISQERGIKEDDDDNDKEAEVDPQAITSVFIKNLNFQTSSADLNKLFKPLEGFRAAQVKMKSDSKTPGKQLSMGFGFAEFNTKKDAEVATTAMNGYTLDGHKLEMKLSHRSHDDRTATKSKPAKSAISAKILIKNVPFETTKKDVQKLFGTFGQLRSVRVPKKFDKTARGFAFAEFVTAKEAENAMKALQGAHLLGRRLVMEYAQENASTAEEEIERMEAKVRKQVTNETLASMRGDSGKRQIDLDGEDDENNNGL